VPVRAVGPSAPCSGGMGRRQLGSNAAAVVLGGRFDRLSLPMTSGSGLYTVGGGSDRPAYSRPEMKAVCLSSKRQPGKEKNTTSSLSLARLDGWADSDRCREDVAATSLHANDFSDALTVAESRRIRPTTSFPVSSMLAPSNSAHGMPPGCTTATSVGRGSTRRPLALRCENAWRTR